MEVTFCWRVLSLKVSVFVVLTSTDAQWAKESAHPGGKGGGRGEDGVQKFSSTSSKPYLFIYF